MSDSGWILWEMRPPYRIGINDGCLAAVPEYEVIEWRRYGDPDDKEPTVSRVADLVAPQNQAWNIANLYWRPVM